MVPKGYPNDKWSKADYWEDVKWYQEEMVKINRIKACQTGIKRDCCKRITKTLTESTNILKNSREELSQTEREQLLEQACSRFNYYAVFYTEG